MSGNYVFLDKDGQPYDLSLNRENNARKAVDLLLGLCSGILADGVVTDGEAELFRRRVEELAGWDQNWPVSYLLARVRAIFADGVVDEDERAELREMMEALCGDSSSELVDDGASASSALPLCSPAPGVYFMGKTFQVTGKFSYGARKKVEGEIAVRGGSIQSGNSITMGTDYLLIGSMASRDWKHSSMGAKILKAVDGRAKGWKVQIVSEGHWVRFL